MGLYTQSQILNTMHLREGQIVYSIINGYMTTLEVMQVPDSKKQKRDSSAEQGYNFYDMNRDLFYTGCNRDLKRICSSPRQAFHDFCR